MNRQKAVYIFPAKNGGILSAPMDKGEAQRRRGMMEGAPLYVGELVARVGLQDAPAWARGDCVSEYDGMTAAPLGNSCIEIFGPFEKVIALFD